MKQHIIILLILFIIISLYNQCNKKNLNKLQNIATNNIIETFSNYLEANASHSGEWGYKITDITDGRYGGRSIQEVLNNIGSHVKDDYITETEKNKYSSYVDSNIAGDIIPPSDCSYSFGNCKWVDSNNNNIAPSEDGQYAKQITSFTAQDYSNNDCPYNANQIVTYDNLPTTEKLECVNNLPPVDCLYEDEYYNLDNFLKIPYSIFTKKNDKQYIGSSCSEIYGSNIENITQNYFTNNPDITNSKRLPDIFGKKPYNIRQDTKIMFNINNNYQKSGWKILTKEFTVKVKNVDSSFNFNYGTYDANCIINNILEIEIESNLYITEEITADNKDYKIFITFKVIDVTYSAPSVDCKLTRYNMSLSNVNNIIKNAINIINNDMKIGLENKIIFSLESNDIGYIKNGPVETLNASLSANHYIDPGSLGNLHNIIKENEEGLLSMKINTTGSYKNISINDITKIIELDTSNETISAFKVNYIGAISIDYNEILLKNLIKRFKEIINADPPLINS
jgi:type II secretory pathway pseudopilin PulG